MLQARANIEFPQTSRFLASECVPFDELSPRLNVITH